MKIQRVSYYFLSADDKPGAISRLTSLLREAKVDLLGLWGFGVGHGKAQLFAVPKDKDLFRSALTSAKWDAVEGTCFRITSDDHVGALADVLDRVAAAGINLQAVDAIGSSGEVGCFVWPQEIDIPKLGEILGA
ncbi:MAG: hypothetical protein KDD44_15185 [Bdellovibrionales bacterium]|nr:hypothetical protein [Bdellovibrionales bacterium]